MICECWPTIKLPASDAAVVIVGLNKEDVGEQSTDQTMRRYVMLLCVLLCWTAQSHGGTLLPTGSLSGPFSWHPVTVLTIIIAHSFFTPVLIRSQEQISQ